MSEERVPSPPSGQPVLRLVPMASDINSFGAVFGGWTMAQLDIAGGLAAMREAGGKVTTAAASIEFEQPLRVGNLVSFYAQLVRRGRTSLTIRVEAWAEAGAAGLADGAGGADGSPSIAAGGAEGARRAAAAEFVFVAIDELGRKRELPPATR